MAHGSVQALILRDGTIPRALIEIEVAATEHGDQFSRYQNWAAGQNPPVACFLVGLDGAGKDVPETWVSKVTLPVLFRSWCNSTDCHVAWLASLAADLFEQWSNESARLISLLLGPIAPGGVFGATSMACACGQGAGSGGRPSRGQIPALVTGAGRGGRGPGSELSVCRSPRAPPGPLRVRAPPRSRLP